MIQNLGTIMDHEIDNSIYYHNDERYIPSNNELALDNSSMPPEIEDNLEAMANAAKASMESRVEEKPFYDWKTKNKSFLNVYNDLYKMGIKNNRFFLRLYDRGLQGVDVYAAVLPIEIQLRIILECFINPWYWLREVCRIPADGKPIEPGGGVAYELDLNNLACWYLFLNGIAHYQSKPRQCGKTQNALAEQNYAFHYGATSATFLFFNKDQNLAKTNLYRFKTQRDLMPSWMQMRSVVTEDGKLDKGIENITTMLNPVTHNMIRVMPRAQSEENANGIGRGYTAAFHHFDEVDFIPHQITIMDASAFSFATASRNSWENGGLACRIFTSTPGDANSKTGKAANEWVSKMLKWEDSFFDVPIGKLISMVNAPGRTPVVFVEHSWKQLKKTIKWYEEQCRLVSYKEERILNEIDLKRIAGNENSPFRRSDLLYISRHVRQPIAKIDMSNVMSPWLIYEEMHKDYPYIFSVDPAEGLSGDNLACTVINPYTLMPAAEFKSPFIAQDDFFEMALQFLDEYATSSMIIVEANKGRELINHFLKSKYSEQLYYDIDKLNSKIVESNDPYGVAKQAALTRRAYGFDTTPASRPKLFSILEATVIDDKDKLCTQYISEDVMGLVRKSSGRIEAGDGFHDDNIMSYLIGLRVYYDASNLEDFGIIRGMREPVVETKESKAMRSLMALKDALPNLPDEIRGYFQSLVNIRQDEFKNGKNNRYREELEREARKQHSYAKRSYGHEYQQYEDEEELLPVQKAARDRYTDEDWAILDEQIVRSNFRDGSEVHIEDMF